MMVFASCEDRHTITMNAPTRKPTALPRRERPPGQRPFTPSRQQLAYLSAWLNPTAPKTIRGIAEQHGLSRRSIYRWMDDDQFVRWFNAELQRHTDGLWQPVLLRVAELALEGSIEHAKVLAQVRGAIRHPETVRTQPVTVIVGVPRPTSPA